MGDDPVDIQRIATEIMVVAGNRKSGQNWLKAEDNKKENEYQHNRKDYFLKNAREFDLLPIS